MPFCTQQLTKKSIVLKSAILEEGAASDRSWNKATISCTVRHEAGMPDGQGVICPTVQWQVVKECIMSSVCASLACESQNEIQAHFLGQIGLGVSLKF